MEVFKSAFSKLKGLLKGKKEKILSIYLIINVFWVFFGMFSYCYLKFSYRNVSTSYILFLAFNVMVIVFINIFKKVKFNVKDIFLILLVLCGIISVIFSKDSSVSLYGCWQRYEGFFQLLYYYTLMYLASFIISDKLKKWIVAFILGFGLFNVGICFLQLFKIFKFISVPYPISSLWNLGQGLVTNSNFFGSYMVLCLGISCGLFLFYKGKIFNKFIFLMLTASFYAGLLMSGAMSGMVGFFVICLLLIIYFIYLCIKKIDVKNNIISYSIFGISIILVSLALLFSGKTTMFGDITKYSGQAIDMTEGKYSDDYGSFRFYIWRNTVKIVPKYLVHGAGIDCFYDAFDKPLVTKHADNSVEYYDKAHNEYLQKLVCEGLVSCVSYLVLLFIIFVSNLKRIIKEHNYLVIGLLLAFVGYCVQAFFNISVIDVAPLFWIVCGLLYNRELKSEL